jgi:hypothetical protein
MAWRSPMTHLERRGAFTLACIVLGLVVAAVMSLAGSLLL